MGQTILATRFAFAKRCLARKLKTWAGAAALALLSIPALGADYPTRPITLVVPVAAGGSATAIAQMTASMLEARLRQPVVVDHRPGAGGYVGAQYVVNAKPDGYTLLLMPSSLLYPDLFAKGQAAVLSRDLVPIASVAQTPYVVTAPASLPIKDLKGFVAHVKTHPDKLNIGVVPGTTALDSFRFKKLAGLEMREIPYNGANEIFPAMLRGDVHLYFVSRASARSFLDSGKLLALAVGSTERFSAMPNVPTLKELGYDLEVTIWYGLFGPANLPADTIARIHKEASEGLAGKEALESLQKLSFDPFRATPAQMKAIVAREREDYGAAAKSAGVKPQ